MYLIGTKICKLISSDEPDDGGAHGFGTSAQNHNVSVSGKPEITAKQPRQHLYYKNALFRISTKTCNQIY